MYLLYSHRNLAGSLALLVANLWIGSTFHQKSSQLPTTHRCRDVKGGVAVLEFGF